MNIEDPAVCDALDACLLTAGSAPAVARLRHVINLQLVDRLTVVTVDRGVVERSIDRTFELFAAAAGSGAPINWLAWIVSTVLTLAAEEVRHLVWLDSVAAGLSSNTPHARRVLVLRVVLTLDPGCEWRLLHCIAQPALAAWATDCLQQLQQRLKPMRAG